MTVKPVIDVTVPTITFLLLIAVGSDLRLADFRRLRARFGLIRAGLLLPLPARAILGSAFEWVETPTLLAAMIAFRARARTAQVAT